MDFSDSPTYFPRILDILNSRKLIPALPAAQRAKWEKKLEKEIGYYEFLQFFFDYEWSKLKKYANALPDEVRNMLNQHQLSEQEKIRVPEMPERHEDPSFYQEGQRNEDDQRVC